MKDQILKYLKEFTQIPSLSDSEKENQGALWLLKTLQEQSYFRKYPENCGCYEIPGDYRSRSIAYGLVKATTDTNSTVILTGHYDVVGIEEYGACKAIAFDVDQMTKTIGQTEIDGETRVDFESGEWLFGRGTADMKGGLCAGLAVLDKLGREGSPINVLFMGVPDEESYSAGMRGAVGLLKKLQKEESLSYDSLLCLEPSTMEENKENELSQRVYIGSVGKCMPVALVQGKKAHIGTCFQGLNAVSVLSRFFLKTEISPDFADVYEGETCVPPTWLHFKDQKELYDVSLPYRACGYINCLFFDTTPVQMIENLKQIGTECFDELIDAMHESKKKITKKAGKMEGKDLYEEIPKKEDCLVLEFSELKTICEKKDVKGFEKYYAECYQQISVKIQTGEWNYPQATIEFLKKILDFADFTQPVMVLAFAPPFYPAFHSDRLPGRERAGSALFTQLCKASDQKLSRIHYFNGISDLSYCGGNGGINDAYYENTPLWGKLYEVDFDAIADLNIPSALYGPWGKDIHQRTERVNIKSLTEDIPNGLLNYIKGKNEKEK